MLQEPSSRIKEVHKSQESYWKSTDVQQRIQWIPTAASETKNSDEEIY